MILKSVTSEEARTDKDGLYCKVIGQKKQTLRHTFKFRGRRSRSNRAFVLLQSRYLDRSFGPTHEVLPSSRHANKPWTLQLQCSVKKPYLWKMTHLHNVIVQTSSDVIGSVQQFTCNDSSIGNDVLWVTSQLVQYPSIESKESDRVWILIDLMSQGNDLRRFSSDIRWLSVRLMMITCWRLRIRIVLLLLIVILRRRRRVERSWRRSRRWIARIGRGWSVHLIYQQKFEGGTAFE